MGVDHASIEASKERLEAIFTVEARRSRQSWYL
jgi:hypothetical protein